MPEAPPPSNLTYYKYSGLHVRVISGLRLLALLPLLPDSTYRRGGLRLIEAA